MNRSAVSPALFDISSDIAGEIPIDLVKQWANSDLSDTTHESLLTPFIIKGTVVCSDSAGVSKLSGERDLIEVMKLISQPKEIIHAYGRAIKGKAVGTWFADNTQMIFSNNVDTKDLIHHLVAAQQEIKNLTVQVGISVHNGEFIEIGHGLYGDDANFVEHLAESFTEGGEIVVTDAIKKFIDDEHCTIRDDLQLGKNVYRLHYDTWQPKAKKVNDELYPIPFNREFYNDLYNKEITKIYERYAKNQIVILINIKHPEDKLLLNKLSNLALGNYYLQQIASNYPITTIKSNGQLAIYTTQDTNAAIEFARDIQQVLLNNDMANTIGISSGEVLLFDLESGAKEIAGGPVNIASKLAEDFGENNHIYIHDSVKIPKEYKSISEPFKTIVSKVELRGRYI